MDIREEILTKVANRHSYETWGELMYDSHDHWQIHCAKEAMDEHAKSKACDFAEWKDNNYFYDKENKNYYPSIQYGFDEPHLTIEQLYSIFESKNN